MKIIGVSARTGATIKCVIVTDSSTEIMYIIGSRRNEVYEFSEGMVFPSIYTSLESVENNKRKVKGLKVETVYDYQTVTLEI